MFKRLEPYKKYVGYGIVGVVVGTLLLLAAQVIQNGPYLLSQIVGTITGFFDIISPVLYAFILAYLLYIPVMFVDKCLRKVFSKVNHNERWNGMIRLLSIAAVITAVVMLFITVINYIIPPLVQNLRNLIQSLPAFEGQISVWVEEMRSYLAELNIDYTSDGQLMMQVQEVLMALGQRVLNGMTHFIGGLSTFVIDGVVTIILTFYFLKDKEKMFAAIDKFGTLVCSERVKKTIKVFIKDLDDVVGNYLVGTILSCFIAGIASTVLMLIIKHPFAIIIGVGAGVTTIIPYVGAIIGAALAFVLGIFTSLELGILGAILLLLYQQIDGNLIQPKIVGDKIGIAPVWILIAVLIGGSYFGGIGMIVAVPIAGLVAVYIDRFYTRKTKRKS